MQEKQSNFLYLNKYKINKTKLYLVQSKQPGRNNKMFFKVYLFLKIVNLVVKILALKLKVKNKLQASEVVHSTNPLSTEETKRRLCVQAFMCVHMHVEARGQMPFLQILSMSTYFVICVLGTRVFPPLEIGSWPGNH